MLDLDSYNGAHYISGLHISKQSENCSYIKFQVALISRKQQPMVVQD